MPGDENQSMLSPKRLPSQTSELAEVRDSLLVLTEVIRHLAERVEVLETLETMGRLRPTPG